MSEVSIIDAMLKATTGEARHWARCPATARLAILEGKVFIANGNKAQRAHTEAFFPRGSTVEFTVFEKGYYDTYKVVV